MSLRPSVKTFLALVLTLPSTANQTAHAQAVHALSRASVLTTLHTFTGVDGATPECTLVLGPDGAFYGTTILGGKGYGTVFKTMTDGRFASLASFDYANGSSPGSLVFDAKSDCFYGSAERGGANGTGTLFRVALDGKITALHSFGLKPDRGDYSNIGGANPFSLPIMGKDGILYGTVRNGGRYGGGCFYKLAADGTYTVLHDFNRDDGQHPEGAPYQNVDGTLYGAAFDGGQDDYGTVYQIGLKGKFKVLHSFSLNDGVYPDTSLTALADGSLWGATRGGRGAGTNISYRITLDGHFTKEEALAEDSHSSSLNVGRDGNFYSTTFHSTPEDGGTVYKVTPQGHSVVLYQFYEGTGGYGPCGGVVFGLEGALYGTTYSGGTDAQGMETGRGTIFKLTLPQ